MKYFKIILFSILIGTIIGILFIKYLNSKIEKEFLNYVILNSQLEDLKITQALCLGLVKTNPKKENLRTCDEIEIKIKKVKNNIELKCSHVEFYNRYIR